jgi:thiamine transport system substrate-binding protein
MKSTKSLILISLLIVIVLILSACKNSSNESVNDDIATDKLIIYCFDSFASWGLGPSVIPEFERLYDCKVILESTGSGGTILNRVLLEQDNPKADIALGMNNSHLFKALSEDVFISYKPTNLSNISDDDLLLDKSYKLIPYEYSYYAFVYDSEVISNPPKTFGEMHSSTWKDKLIFIDPRTSSPGYGLLIWTLSIYGERGFDQFWDSLKNNILISPSSWNEAYSAFLAGEAPIVLSYATSPAYHIENENITKYKAFIPEEGGFREIGFAGIIKGSKNMYLAKKFIEYMLTEDFQKHIPEKQWTMPVINNIELPESYANLPVPTKDLSAEAFKHKNFFSDKWLDKWTKIMTSKKK